MEPRTAARRVEGGDEDGQGANRRAPTHAHTGGRAAACACAVHPLVRQECLASVRVRTDAGPPPADDATTADLCRWMRASAVDTGDDAPLRSAEALWRRGCGCVRCRRALVKYVLWHLYNTLDNPQSAVRRACADDAFYDAQRDTLRAALSEHAGRVARALRAVPAHIGLCLAPSCKYVCADGEVYGATSAVLHLFLPTDAGVAAAADASAALRVPVPVIDARLFRIADVTAVLSPRRVRSCARLLRVAALAHMLQMHYRLLRVRQWLAKELVLGSSPPGADNP